MFEQLLCDCDGALVVSDAVAHRALADLLSAALPEIDPESIEQAVFGPLSPPPPDEIAHRLGVVLPPDFDAQLARNVEQALARSCAPIAEIRAALARIALPAAIVSNQRVAQLALAVARVGLAGHVGGRLFGADMVARAKPHPDLYQHAARALGVEPARCVAVADNLAGLDAARAAGMRTIAFVGSSHQPGGYAQALRRLGVSVIVERMDQVPALLAGGAQGTYESLPHAH